MPVIITGPPVGVGVSVSGIPVVVLVGLAVPAAGMVVDVLVAPPGVGVIAPGVGVVPVVWLGVGKPVLVGAGVVGSKTGVRVGRRVPVLVAVAVSVAVGGMGVLVYVAVGSCQGRGDSGFCTRNRPRPAKRAIPSASPNKRIRVLSCFISTTVCHSKVRTCQNL